MTAVLLDACLEAFQASLLTACQKADHFSLFCGLVAFCFILCLFGCFRGMKIKKKVFYHIVEF